MNSLAEAGVVLSFPVRHVTEDKQKEECNETKRKVQHRRDLN
jgi:hypothetical protein